MIQFFQTIYGKRFFDGQLPKLIEEIGRLADAAEISNRTPVLSLKELQAHVDARANAEATRPRESAGPEGSVAVNREKLRGWLEWQDDDYGWNCSACKAHREYHRNVKNCPGLPHTPDCPTLLGVLPTLDTDAFRLDLEHKEGLCGESCPLCEEERDLG